jgi:ABC-type sugar transport system permease subunit
MHDATSQPDVVTSRLRLAPAEHARLARRFRMRRQVAGWLFLGPLLSCFVTFLLFPIVGTFWWSTRTGSVFSGTKFAGLDNYRRLPGTTGALDAIFNTLIFSIASVPLILAGAMAVGLLLSRVSRGGSVYRFLVYLPVLVPGVVAGLMWLFLARPDYGLFNVVLQAVGLPPVNWLGRDTALGMVVAVDVWRNVGYWAIFFLAAIIGLPKELYQAAELDGANAVTRFFALTLPLMRRIIFFAVIVATIWALQVFDTVLILTGGGPGSATTTIVMRIWGYAFGSSNKVGYASAISVIFICATLALTLVQMWLLRDRRGPTGG